MRGKSLKQSNFVSICSKGFRSAFERSIELENVTASEKKLHKRSTHIDIDLCVHLSPGTLNRSIHQVVEMTFFGLTTARQGLW